MLIDFMAASHRPPKCGDRGCTETVKLSGYLIWRVLEISCPVIKYFIQQWGYVYDATQVQSCL